jgi:excinuclease UvrABC ATPase subunit
MATQRFHIRKEINRTWTIFDVFSMLHVVVGDEPTIGLAFEDARDLANVMNALDREHMTAKLASKKRVHDN